MATHNATDGTGGLDGSIQFELDRVENVGDGFNNTLLVIFSQSNRYMGLADMIALAAVIAIEECGGPKIDFRGGRVDATEAGPPGVPEPQQSLIAHTASFARQGFSPTETIGLVACGHTFGGVQHTSFPDIVPASDDPNNTEGDVLFDSTGSYFDNKIVTEYLAGTTQDPLVIGHNDTTNSDKRIFGSDGNATMQALADPAVYASTCATLFSKMIHTVAGSVQLTDIIEPISVKPDAAQLVYTGDGTLRLFGLVRFWGLEENLDRVVTIKWADREGNTCSGCSGVIGHTPDMVSTFTATNTPSVWYQINTTDVGSFISIDETAGISKFWFEVDEGNGSTSVEDQGGLGFVLSDGIMITNTTCLSRTSLNLNVAVRKGANPSRVYVEVDAINPVTTAVDVVQTFDIPPPTNTQPMSNYDIWSLQISNQDWPSGKWNVAADIGDKKITTFYLQSTFSGCPS